MLVIANGKRPVSRNSTSQYPTNFMLYAPGTHPQIAVPPEHAPLESNVTQRSAYASSTAVMRIDIPQQVLTASNAATRALNALITLSKPTEIQQVLDSRRCGTQARAHARIVAVPGSSLQDPEAHTANERQLLKVQDWVLVVRTTDRIGVAISLDGKARTLA